MACGLKKQNNEQGVHLTERTCSPYNPIIKLIVDDCLGLPIYPVTSIDAVIDEDGNTLRKLLEDIVDRLNAGNSLTTEQLEQLLEIIDCLDTTYVSYSELNAKLQLLYKISSMDRSVADGAFAYVENTSKPFIVGEIERIDSALQGLLNGGEGLSLQGLLDQINALNKLLFVVANYRPSDEHSEEGLKYSTENTGHIVEIIYQIQNLISRLLSVEEALGTGSSEGTIIQRLGELEGTVSDLLNRVSALEEASSTHAHLDERVLGQIPSTLDSNVPGDVLRISHYKTLKISEYPPTTAKFLITGDEFSFNDVVYFGFLPNKECSNPLMDLYPFGHINLSKGLPIFYKREGIDSNYVALRDDENNQLRMGDGILNGSDIIEIHKINKEMPVDYYTEVSNAPNLTFKDLYVQVSDGNSNRYILVGNVNDDSEAQTTGDINVLIDTYINATENASSANTFNVPAPYSPKQNLGWLTYFGSSDIVLYPCILGKIYVDSLTGNAYRYESNKMYPVAKEEVVGGSGITVTLTTEYTNVDEDNDIYKGPYKLYAININSNVIPSVESGIGIDVDFNESLNKYTVNRFPKTGVCLYGLDPQVQEGTLCIGAKKISLFRYGVEEDGLGNITSIRNGDINMVTEAIDALLGKSPIVDSDNLLEIFAANLWFKALKANIYGMLDEFKVSSYYDESALDNTGNAETLQKYDYTLMLIYLTEYVDNLFKKEDAGTGQIIPRTYYESLAEAAQHEHIHLDISYFGGTMLQAGGGGSANLRTKFYLADPTCHGMANNDVPNDMIFVGDCLTPAPRSRTYNLFISAIFDVTGDGVFDINDVTAMIVACGGLEQTWDDIDPVVDIEYELSLNVRNDNPTEGHTEADCFDEIENSDIEGQTFYEISKGELWVSNGAEFIKAFPEYRLLVGSGSSWISLEKDGIVILSVQSGYASSTASEETLEPSEQIEG